MSTIQSTAAPRTIEELLSAATSGRQFGMAHRPARGHGHEMRGLSHVPVSRLFEGRFGRMFRLSPYVPDADRIARIADRMLEGTAGHDGAKLDNPCVPAGYTYLGQFIDHDLTFDPVSLLTRQNDPDALTDFRSPRFDLDCLYGRGPADDPFLYDKSPGREDMFLIGRNDEDADDDLPRNIQKTALIGDPRNDENIFVSQLHLTMLKFHNAVVAHVRDNPGVKRDSETTFEAVQRIVRWHYQWIVVHDYLRRTVGQAMLDEVLDVQDGIPRLNLRHYTVRTTEPYMPVEFSVAAFRFGHSQIRQRYSLNSLVRDKPVFCPGSVAENPLGHFGGFRALPGFWTVEWRRFFDVAGEGDGELQFSRRIDTMLADPLRQLPTEIGGNRPSLIDRNLTRGAQLSLPSGQTVAEAMEAPVLTDAELALPDGGPAPLWYYVLREASVKADGMHLGPVGGRLVAEVFLGLLAKDPSSYLRQDPRWTPFLPSRTPNQFAMPDLIAFAGHGLAVTNLTGR